MSALILVAVFLRAKVRRGGKGYCRNRRNNGPSCCRWSCGAARSAVGGQYDRTGRCGCRMGYFLPLGRLGSFRHGLILGKIDWPVPIPPPQKQVLSCEKITWEKLKNKVWDKSFRWFGLKIF